MTDANFYDRIFQNGSGVPNVLENIPVLIMAVDESSRIVFWNRELEKITGYSYTEVTEDTEHFFPFYYRIKNTADPLRTSY